MNIDQWEAHLRSVYERHKARNAAGQVTKETLMSELIVYGANCTWWDSLSKSAMVPGTQRVPGRPRSGLPCCPHCGSVLFQTEEDKWHAGIASYEAAGNPGYADLMTWARGKCFQNMDQLRAAYAASITGATG